MPRRAPEHSSRRDEHRALIAKPHGSKRTVSTEDPITALILAGGRGRRLGMDKLHLRIGGAYQLERIVAVVRSVADEIVVSRRRDQVLPPRLGQDQIHCVIDNWGDIGPLGGVLSAMDAFPDRLWLVLAIDMPFVDDEVLRTLMKERNQHAPFTAFLNPETGQPEPFCALYESNSVNFLKKAYGESGERSLRRIIMQSEAPLIPLPAGVGEALRSVNTQIDLRDAGTKIEHR